MPKDNRSPLPFDYGDSLFLFEPGQVRILGQQGTEAAVPYEDLKALLDHLDRTEEAPPIPNPPGLLSDETD